MIYHNEGDGLGDHVAHKTFNANNKQLTNVSGVGFLGSFGVRNELTKTVLFSPSGDSLAVTNKGISLNITPPLDNSSPYIMVWSSGSKEVSYRHSSGLGAGTLSKTLTGDGTHANPVTDVDLALGASSVDISTPVYWSQGQAGILSADGTMATQPRFIVPSGYQITLFQVFVTLGKAGNSDTSLQYSVLNHNGSSAPTPGSPTATLTVGSGVAFYKWTALEGTTLNSLQHIQTRVDVAGSDAENLCIHFWGKTTAGA